MLTGDWDATAVTLVVEAHVSVMEGMFCVGLVVLAGVAANLVCAVLVAVMLSGHIFCKMMGFITVEFPATVLLTVELAAVTVTAGVTDSITLLPV